jgi:hypothetical protein
MTECQGWHDRHRREVPTHKTRLGIITVDQVSLTEWRAEAPDLRVNGKGCCLDQTHVVLSQHSWSMNTLSSLRRRDGGRVTARGREKVEEAIRTVIDCEIGDQLIVVKARWELTHQHLLRDRASYEDTLRRLDDRIRNAACQVKAHSLPGAQGEVARVLVRESWDKTPEELEEMVQILTG